jgi:hypothetical protein
MRSALMPPPIHSPVLASGDFHHFGLLELPTGGQNFLSVKHVYGARREMEETREIEKNSSPSLFLGYGHWPAQIQN